MDLQTTVDALYNTICVAFASVTLGDGIGLWEAQAIDDHADKSTRSALRERDEKHDWSAVSIDDLNMCYSSPSFYDAEGMRFYLPAMLIASLSSRADFDVIFYLTRLDDFSLNKFCLLNDQQRRVVRQFLEYHLHLADYGFEKSDIELALATYWK